MAADDVQIMLYKLYIQDTLKILDEDDSSSSVDTTYQEIRSETGETHLTAVSVTQRSNIFYGYTWKQNTQPKSLLLPTGPRKQKTSLVTNIIWQQKLPSWSIPLPKYVGYKKNSWWMNRPKYLYLQNITSESSNVLLRTIPLWSKDVWEHNIQTWPNDTLVKKIPSGVKTTWKAKKSPQMSKTTRELNTFIKPKASLELNAPLKPKMLSVVNVPCKAQASLKQLISASKPEDSWKPETPPELNGILKTKESCSPPKTSPKLSGTLKTKGSCQPAELNGVLKPKDSCQSPEFNSILKPKDSCPPPELNGILKPKDSCQSPEFNSILKPKDSCPPPELNGILKPKDLSPPSKTASELNASSKSKSFWQTKTTLELITLGKPTYNWQPGTLKLNASLKKKYSCHPRTPSKINATSMCNLCKKNGELASFYMGHRLKDASGRVTCPILRTYKCPLCACPGGDYAHTISYCPLKNIKGVNSHMSVNCTPRNSTSLRRCNRN